MIYPIVHDEAFLSRVSRKAVKEDRDIALSLLETLSSHHDDCVGLAANMIGFDVAIIAVSLGIMDIVMLNPRIVDRKNSYVTEEGCLSLRGLRKTVRYQSITVKYQDLDMREKTQVFTGFTAQIIQHETDHLRGILI